VLFFFLFFFLYFVLTVSGNEKNGKLGGR